jgi:hypothetical protein
LVLLAERVGAGRVAGLSLVIVELASFAERVARSPPTEADGVRDEDFRLIRAIAVVL